VSVVLFGGGYDLAIPLVPEQTDVFVKLTTPNYLVITNTSHTQQITKLLSQVLLPNMVTNELDEKLDSFLKNSQGLGLAFMQMYVAGRSDYRPYLQASYMQTLHVRPFTVDLVQSFSADQLNQLMQKAGL
jgi:predicted dienelactone hydrolase